MQGHVAFRRLARRETERRTSPFDRYVPPKGLHRGAGFGPEGSVSPSTRAPRVLAAKTVSLSQHQPFSRRGHASEKYGLDIHGLRCWRRRCRAARRCAPADAPATSASSPYRSARRRRSSRRMPHAHAERSRRSRGHCLDRAAPPRGPRRRRSPAAVARTAPVSRLSIIDTDSHHYHVPRTSFETRAGKGGGPDALASRLPEQDDVGAAPSSARSPMPAPFVCAGTGGRARDAERSRRQRRPDPERRGESSPRVSHCNSLAPLCTLSAHV